MVLRGKGTGKGIAHNRRIENGQNIEQICSCKPMAFYDLYALLITRNLDEKKL